MVRHLWKKLYRMTRVMGYEITCVTGGRYFAVVGEEWQWPRIYDANTEGLEWAIDWLES